MIVKHIDKFMFNNASYRVTDNQGGEVLLKIDYVGNNFEIECINSKISKTSLIEVESIARDLLERKHQVNFAEKE